MADTNSTVPTDRQEVVDQLEVDINVVKEDIHDFIDEISYDSMDPEEVVARLESMRTKLRTLHHKFWHYSPERFDTEYKDEFESLVAEMKDSIRQSRDVKSKMNAHQKMAVVNEEKAMLFQVETALRVIDESKMNWTNQSKLPKMINLLLGGITKNLQSPSWKKLRKSTTSASSSLLQVMF